MVYILKSLADVFKLIPALKSCVICSPLNNLLPRTLLPWTFLLPCGGDSILFLLGQRRERTYNSLIINRLFLIYTSLVVNAKDGSSNGRAVNFEPACVLAEQREISRILWASGSYSNTHNCKSNAFSKNAAKSFHLCLFKWHSPIGRFKLLSLDIQAAVL